MRSKIPEPVPYKGDCERHGKFDGMITSLFGREIKSVCPDCGKEKREAEREREAAELAKHLADAAERRLERKLGSAAIPARFQGKTFAAYVTETDRQVKALTICREYAENFDAHLEAGRCLMLMGKPGCGKTHLGAAIASHVCLETKHTAIYRTMPGLVNDIRASYGGTTDYTEAEVIHAITTAGLLVLDEIGATKASEFELSLIFNVINTRYEQRLPTVIISNLPPAELKNAIGDRCVDRLREGGGIVVGFDWESKRGEL